MPSCTKKERKKNQIYYPVIKVSAMKDTRKKILGEFTKNLIEILRLSPA